jgi:mannose-6-phosphate isomerase-like protein (cupin superfamily)
MATLKLPPHPRSAGRENETEWLEMTPGERFTIRTSSRATNDAYVVLEVVAEPGNGVPMHIHENEEEHFIIVDGTAHLANGDKVLDLTAGSAVTVGKGVPHAWCNRTDVPLRMLVIFTPGHIEGLFRATAEEKGDGDLLAIANAYGTRIVGPALLEGIYTTLTPRSQVS